MAFTFPNSSMCCKILQFFMGGYTVSLLKLVQACQLNRLYTRKRAFILLYEEVLLLRIILLFRRHVRLKVIFPARSVQAPCIPQPVVADLRGSTWVTSAAKRPSPRGRARSTSGRVRLLLSLIHI